MKSACPIINSHHDCDVTKDSDQWEPEISSGQSLASAQNPRVGGGRKDSCLQWGCLFPAHINCVQGQASLYLSLPE